MLQIAYGVQAVAFMLLNVWDTLAMGNFPFASDYLVFQQTGNANFTLPHVTFSPPLVCRIPRFLATYLVNAVVLVFSGLPATFPFLARDSISDHKRNLLGWLRLPGVPLKSYMLEMLFKLSSLFEIS